jgi:hypothetical protein
MSTGSEDQTQERAMEPGPLFVVSMWRSGSSLLYALLNKHPQVALMYEADLLMLKPVFLKPAAFCDWSERWEFWNEAFQRHGLTAGDVDESISDFPSAFKSAHRLYAKRHGATIWGDKSPNYYDRLNEMADDFPEVRFIIVWRDPKKECDRLLARGKSVCQVNYEDLIQDTPSVMRHVCEFLQIPYDDSLAVLEGADRSAILEGQHHANLKGDKIVRGPRLELIGAALRKQILQYEALWHRIYGSAWPRYPQSADNSVQPSSRFSRLGDRALYLTLRVRDRISPLVFSFIPISLLRRYREAKRRRREASNVAQPGPVDAGGASCAVALNRRAAHGEGRG